MSDTFTVVLNTSGVRELLKSKEIMDCVEETAKLVQAKCGDGYEVDTFSGRNRVNAHVSTADIHAINDNLKHNTLLKAVSSK